MRIFCSPQITLVRSSSMTLKSARYSMFSKREVITLAILTSKSLCSMVRTMLPLLITLLYPYLGCWSPDGLRFVVSTYFGSFSLYGYDSLDLYRTTPTEQFFANDTDIFIFSESLVPLSVDDDEVQINSKKRGKICDYQRIPYRFEFPNSFESLKSKGFLDEQIGEDYIAEDKRLTVEERKRIALKETNKAFLEKCDGIREHLLAKN